ncbi:lycopene cyclase [Cellulomonas sp. DKR-3]|uniref:Lycopene cyclase n=1 Tax=Cellulomonas fulva TaxID=2835530 RepID=A0ABS5U0R6_9CELL|nr:lycopene cyclase [Cellulomonas fulva]MBT0994955.1 lycopene cyclase [Cellulomonas fulva]
MTYVALAVPFLAVSAAVLTVAAATERRRGRRGAALLVVAIATGAVLSVLTVVFDSAMIAADLFRYDEASLLGPRLWLTPVEDLAWPWAAALLLPALHALLTPAHVDRTEATA